MRHILIDTDTGSDDAVALVMALNNSKISIEAITVVAKLIGQMTILM